MKNKTIPLYNNIFFRKKILIEKVSKEFEEVWEGHYILEFSNDNKEYCKFLINSEQIQSDLISHFGNEYFNFKINIIENIGNDDGKYFLNWINSFYNEKNNYYNFNIYDSNSKSLQIYSITKNLKKLIKFNLSSCVIKNPLFFEYNKSNKNSPQISFNLCSKDGIVISHLK
jgi:hypothetical protein